MWAAIHRWLGLTLGVVLMSSGLSGALLVIARPLDTALNAHLHEARTPGRDAPSLDAAVARLRAEFPAAELVVRLPRAEGKAVQVNVRGAWHGEVFVDPASGAELGRRAEDEGFANWIFEWHSALLTEERGKIVLLAAGLAGLALSVLGLVLWWPRGEGAWRRAFRVRWRGNITRTLFDAHRAVGAVMALVLLASIASGLYMAWRPISSAVNALAGFDPPPLPRVGPSTVAAPLSRLIHAADAALPGGRISIVVLPASSDRLVRVRKQMPDEPHPNGLSSVWLHPATAEPVRVVPWREGGAGLLGFEFLYPLHIGALGGTPHRVLTAVTGLVLFLLGASGAWVWWRRVGPSGKRVPERGNRMTPQGGRRGMP